MLTLENDRWLTEAFATERSATGVRTVVTACKRHEAVLQTTMSDDVDTHHRHQDDDDDDERRDDPGDRRLRHSSSTGSTAAGSRRQNSCSKTNQVTTRIVY